MPKLHNDSLPATSDARAPADNNIANLSTPIRHRQRAVPDPSAVDRRATDYEVGYGRPPVQTRFRPGASGNRNGRPKKATTLKAVVREMMTQKVQVRTTAGVIRISKIEALLHKVFELAIKGNLPAQRVLLNLYSTAAPEPITDTLNVNDEIDESTTYLQDLARKFLVDRSSS